MIHVLWIEFRWSVLLIDFAIDQLVFWPNKLPIVTQRWKHPFLEYFEIRQLQIPLRRQSWWVERYTVAPGNGLGSWPIALNNDFLSTTLDPCITPSYVLCLIQNVFESSENGSSFCWYCQRLQNGRTSNAGIALSSMLRNFLRSHCASCQFCNGS